MGPPPLVVCAARIIITASAFALRLELKGGRRPDVTMEVRGCVLPNTSPETSHQQKPCLPDGLPGLGPTEAVEAS